MIPVPSTGRPFRISRTGLIAAMVTFLMFATSGAAYAYWSAQASLSSTATAGSISVSLTNVSSIQNTFVNDTRMKTGSITVVNTSATTSTAALPVSISFGIVAGGSAVLAANLDVTLWGPIAASSCTNSATPSGTVTTGTWASFSALSTTLSAGQSGTWCLRTANVERSTLASATGTLTIQPKVTATLTAGTWTATSSATSTQNTQYIFPAYLPSSISWFSVVTSTGTCLEVPAFGGAGSSLAQTVCSVVTNQAFQLSGADSNGYLSLTPKHNVNLRWDNGGSTAPGSAVTVQTATGSGNQSWQLQMVSFGVYQIVNKISGLCVSASSASPSSTTQALCNGSGAQNFTLAAVTFTTILVCTNNGNTGSKGRVTYSWTTAGTYTFQADHDITAGVNWLTIGTSAPSALSVDIGGTLPIADPVTAWPGGPYDVRMLDDSGAVVATTTLTVRPSGGFECG